MKGRTDREEKKKAHKWHPGDRPTDNNYDVKHVPALVDSGFSHHSVSPFLLCIKQHLAKSGLAIHKEVFGFHLLCFFISSNLHLQRYREHKEMLERESILNVERRHETLFAKWFQTRSMLSANEAPIPNSHGLPSDSVATGSSPFQPSSAGLTRTQKGRGMSKNNTLNKLIHDTGNNLKVEMPLHLETPVGKVAAVFKTEVGIISRDHAPISCAKWKYVQDSKRLTLYKRIEVI
ncbi:hypothetical protein F0562_003880 [Nyssa sinensis]|uniref:Uncharacterized protein n=1 Tax=Nyssa sinensis TaxID=561372 RepID=A0A5J5BW41_9ASTE|nr:hypothetical protein F0562_003880 [Nyssa sinensis]